MRRVIFGQVITATDVERLPPDDGAVAFVRLCGALIGAALTERASSLTLPDISERVNVPDGGVDASYTAPIGLDITEAGGLVGPGTTFYQFKYRDSTAATRGVLFNRIVQKLREDLRGAPPEADRYVLMTNLELSREHRRRLREALIEAHPPMATKAVVVWGAAEIAQALNATPRLRLVFFSGSGLSTLDTAKSELRAVYERVGWPAFVGREGERKAIESFADDPRARYLELVGVRYSGRTRLVIEALEKRGASVVWASEPEVATLDVFRELDSHEFPGILVVDDCTPATLREIRDRALSRQRLKTIGISTGGEKEAWWAGPGRIVVDRLPYGDAARLVRSVLPRVAPLQGSWVIEAAGGIPGLALHVAALLRDGAVSPASDPDVVQRRLGDLLHDQYTNGLSAEAQKALAAASVLSVVGVEGDVRHEVDAVSRALGIEPGTFERARDELEDRGLVRRRGRFVEVVPPRLAEEVASRALSRPEMTIAELQLRLTNDAFMRFLERLRALRGGTSTRTVASILGAGGWFQDLDSLERGAQRFEALVPAAPGEALRCLERLLGPLSGEELLRRVTGDFRRSVVFALDKLALGSQTFSGAARLLLALAEAEDDDYANNARGTFVSLFHWNHPEVSAPLPLRQEVLEEAISGSAARRAIVAKACGTAFSEHGFVVLHHATGPAVPEGPGRPRTWEEVRGYGEAVLAIIDRLIADPDAAVREEAVTSLLEVGGSFVKLSLLPDGFHLLGRKALDTLERVGREARSARRRSHVVSRLELIAENLRDRAEATTPEGTAATALDRVRSLIEVLTTRTLRDRLWHWVGPRTWAREVDPGGPERTVGEIHAVAAELAAKPQALLDELPWLTSEDAEHRSPLFHELGRLDRGERLLDLLLGEPGDQFWAQALAAYFQGWREAEPDPAGRALDALIASRPDLSAGTLAATMYLPTSSETARRVQQIARQGRTPRPELARQLAFGLAWDRLGASDAETLIASIDDQTTETRSALLHAIWLRLVRGAEISAGLEALGWSFLESSLPVDGERARNWGWDALGAKLGERDSKRLLALFARLVRESVSAGRPRFQVSNDLARTWKTLLRKERQGVLEVLLELSLNPDPPYWLDWTLSKEIRPDEDLATLLAFAERNSIDGARVVADVVDPERPGFWRLAREFLARWGQDQRLAARLASRTLSGSWLGSAVPLISGRMRSAQALASDPDPTVVHWAQAVLADLEEWRKSAAREDREEWIWDQPISRAELEGMLERKDTSERLWAIGRLLKDAPESRVQELLTPEDILDALPRLGHLDERTRRKWEAWARHWSRAD
ncbi:MAG: hypothetical protein ACREJ9_17390 [Candidatus Rokuibacteriota bacterium]